jgi:alkylation response protein AidB-like acyl-CoA dehydrogenase
VDFAWSAEAEQVRAEARELFGAIVTDDVLARVRETGTHDDPLVRRALADKRWLIAHWPPEEGGRGWDGLSVAALRRSGPMWCPFRGLPQHDARR